MRRYILFTHLIHLLINSEGFVSKSRMQSKETKLSIVKPIDNDSDKNELNQDYHEKNLYAKLIQHIRNMVEPSYPPVSDNNLPVEVYIKAALYQIVDLDQRSNMATFTGYFDAWWIDPLIQWNETNFNGIKKTFIPSKWVWKPEFYFYHGVEGRVPYYTSETNIEINSNGRLRAFIPVTARVLCPVNVKYFPFDTQNCTLACGSWSYPIDFVKLLVDQKEVFLGDFYDNQEWLLENATIYDGTIIYLEDESFSTIYLELILRRQSFYYVFNFVFPVTLISMVAVVGFHAPINATGRRESKFRLGIMTLLSMSVMLLMLVDEMKFALASIPGQRGSFSDVPLLGVFHMIQMLIISIATCTSVFFVHLEKYALRNPYYQAVPWCLRFLSGKEIFCSNVSSRFRDDKIERNQNIATHFVSPSADNSVVGNLIPKEVNFVDYHQEAITTETNVETAPSVSTQRIELLVSLMREFIQNKQELHRRHTVPDFWERLIDRLECISLIIYVLLIMCNVTMFMKAELWY